MKRKILVTGAHRSGSTWAGLVVARAKNVRYVHEPFNKGMNKSSPLKLWFEYLTDSPLPHQEKVKAYIDSFCELNYIGTIKRVKKIGSFRDAYHFLADTKARLIDRTVIKDPIALMSAEWLYRNYDLDVIVLIRHPAAFVASLKVKNWQFGFETFKNQHNLLRDHLKDYEDLIDDYTKNKRDIIDQGILAWNIFHHVITYYQSKFENEWHFVRHEDLSRNPIEEFEKMFSKVGLKLNRNAIKYIEKTSTAEEKSKLERNSKDNIKTWKARLTKEEISRIKLGTEEIWKKFYSEDDW